MVLVTVPQCLEILLLSSAHRTWVASIKHVIYDEVRGQRPICHRSQQGEAHGVFGLRVLAMSLYRERNDGELQQKQLF